MERYKLKRGKLRDKFKFVKIELNFAMNMYCTVYSTDPTFYFDADLGPMHLCIDTVRSVYQCGLGWAEPDLAICSGSDSFQLRQYVPEPIRSGLSNLF